MPTYSGRQTGFLCCAVVMLLTAGLVSDSRSQDDSEPAPPASPDAIHDKQLRIQRDYQRFEKQLYDLAEHVRLKDPERADVLYRARSQSQEQRILTEMQAISELLREGRQYGPAADRQEDLLARMKAVLKLLQSLDDRERIEREIKFIEDLLKDTSKIIARQKDVHADTQRGQSAERSESQQKKVADDAEKLAEKIDRHDREQNEQQGKQGEDRKQDQKPEESPEDKPSEKGDGDSQGESQDSKSQGQKSQEGSEQKSDGQKPMEGEQSQSQQSQQQGQQPMPGSQQQQGQPSEQQQEQQQQTAGREELEQARQAMQQAIEQLQKELPDKAGDAQREAIERLEKLKAELERILRQLREEEKETYLTLLEARFQNMLRRQERINNETTRLDAVPAAERPSTFADKALGVKREQDENTLDAEKALTLLKEEGSSVAFPEAIEQMKENMQLVAGRLAAADTGKTTQLVEQLIVDSLNEMILAFQKELEKQQEKKQQGQPQQQQQGEPGLVNQLAELKMIRSLQKQINQITAQLAEDVSDSQSLEATQQKLIDDLARRQERIQEATYDLTVGKNR